MNQPGLRNVTGRPMSLSDCSIRVRWVSRFSCGASAPMVERHTTLPGRASIRAARTASMTRRASGKPGSGSNSDGGRMKTPAAPLKAAARLAASSMSATAISQPWACHSVAFAASRSTARTFSWSASRPRARAPPTLPVIPVMAYIISLQSGGEDRAGSSESGVEAALERAIEGDDPFVVERQDLGEEGAGDLADRIEPEIAVEQAGPGDAAGGAPVRSRLGIDVEGQAPFVRLARELVEALGVAGLGRPHLVDVERTDLVLHHAGDRFGPQDPAVFERAAVQQRLQKHEIIARRAEGAAAAHEELGPLRHLERCRIEAAVGTAAVQCRDALF